MLGKRDPVNNSPPTVRPIMEKRLVKLRAGNRTTGTSRNRWNFFRLRTITSHIRLVRRMLGPMGRGTTIRRRPRITQSAMFLVLTLPIFIHITPVALHGTLHHHSPLKEATQR